MKSWENTLQAKMEEISEKERTGGDLLLDLTQFLVQDCSPGHCCAH